MYGPVGISPRVVGLGIAVIVLVVAVIALVAILTNRD
jgi:hypothetical protein